ncbi:T9SS type A sorting domain-containing protein [Chryseobacterium tongliaoense]|uniref:T9SS type A sorting domain-containing protein n=1 Tax=Chryseobacterium tongliaoense TaxID=3240933 RepID=UPI0035197736
MKKILFYFFLLAVNVVNAQNNNCSGAVALTLGTNFATGAITSTNVAATTDGSVPSCQTDASENVWFSVVVPPSGKLTVETRQQTGSLFDDSVLTVYSGACGSLTQIGCDDDDGQGAFSLVSLTGQTPGATLYISVWKYDSSIDSGQFRVSAYDPFPVANDNCTQAVSLTVGTDFTTSAITATNVGATTDGSAPSCRAAAVDNVWFKVIVPASGNLKIETREAVNSLFDDSVITVYSGTCGSLTQIACNDDGNLIDSFSLVSLTGQTPGTTLYVSVWKYSSVLTDNGEFQISAFDNSVLSTNEVSVHQEKIDAFPNPFIDQLTISHIDRVKSISITDVSGRLVKQIKQLISPLYLGDLQHGIYYITLKMNDGSTRTIKTIKK